MKRPDSILEAVQFAKQKLKIVTDVPMLEAEILLAHALHTTREMLHAYSENKMNLDEQASFEKMLARRLCQEPIAYITGHCAFWSLNLTVNSFTLIPRPETELLVECVLAFLGNHVCIADIGTGCGAIALALASEQPSWEIYATDKSSQALAVAKKNAEHLGLGQVIFLEGDGCIALPKHKLFDAIISNPPYLSMKEWEYYGQNLSFEPKGALLAGPSGLEIIQLLIAQSKSYLKRGGYIFLEHGFAQKEQVQHLLEEAGYHDIESFKDLAQHHRVMKGVF